MLASTIASSRRGLIVLALVVIAFVAIPAGVYVLADPEHLGLDDAVRSRAGGQFIKLTDGYTHYELTGPPSGHVVVLAAGFSVPYYIWDPTFKALTDAGFRVLRYDYFGRGFSDRPDVPYNDAFYVRQLSELLDKLGVRNSIDLVGLSFGGTVISNFADSYPDRVRSLIYIDPAFRSPSSAPSMAKYPAVWSFFTAIFEERWWADEQLGDFLHPERFPDWPDRYRVQMQYKGFRRARLSEIVTNAEVDQRPQLERIGEHSRPVLVIWGKQDPSVSFEFSSSLMEIMPHGRLVPVDQSGHLPQWERPDVVHPALITFLHQVNESQP